MKLYDMEYIGRVMMKDNLTHGNKMIKSELIKFMHACGFDWICDVACVNGMELVASKMIDCDDLWWRHLEVEGSGFIQLFKGSVKQLNRVQNETE